MLSSDLGFYENYAKELHSINYYKYGSHSIAIQEVREIVSSLKTLISEKEFSLALAKTVAESVQVNLEKTFEDQNRVIFAMQQRITAFEEQNKQLGDDNNKLINELDDLNSIHEETA